MPAYLVANLDVHDLERYSTDYATPAGRSVARHGGRYIVRGGRLEILEGNDFRDRLVIIEFESVEAALAWYHSEEYQAAIPARQRFASGSMVIVDGVAPGGGASPGP